MGNVVMADTPSANLWQFISIYGIVTLIAGLRPF